MAKNQLKSQTIAGILTPVGEGGIGVVAVKGPNALDLVCRFFRGTRIQDVSQLPSNRLCHGFIGDKRGVVDEVILRVRGSARGAYAEVNCHGGVAAVRKVLSLFVQGGAQEAAGEQLLTALQEDLDAIQKEAMVCLVSSRTFLAASVLLDQFHGALSNVIAEVLCGGGVAGVKDAQHEVGADGRLDGANACTVLRELLDNADFGVGLCVPRRVVIAGKPNVGKSTLLNSLLKEERVIVHEEAGTTRDAIAEEVEIDGIPLQMVDTAGMRKTAQEVEMLGVQVSKKEIAEADIVLLLFDATRELDGNDEELLEMTEGWTVIPILNKIDKIDGVVAWDVQRVEARCGRGLCRVSALYGQGLAKLEARIARHCMPVGYSSGQAVIFTERQRMVIQKAREAFAAGAEPDGRRFLERCLREQMG